MTDERAVRLASQIGALHVERYALIDEVASMRAELDALRGKVERVEAECDAAEDYGIEDEDGDRWVLVPVIRAALGDPA